MAKRLIFSEKFRRSMERFMVCSHDIYNQNTLLRLKDGIRQNGKLLTENPYYGAVEFVLNERDEFRRIVIKPYFKMLYVVEEDDIVLVDIWDTRRNPSYLKESLFK